MFELQLLGTFSLHRGPGNSLAGLPKRAPQLLMLLALGGPGCCTREQVAAFLWCEASAERARQSLRQLLSDLRHQGLPLGVDAGRLALKVGEVRVDVHDFERLAASASADALEQALGHYRGPLVSPLAEADGEFEAWRMVEQTRLHRCAVAACNRLAGLVETAGDDTRLVKVLQRGLELEPSAEDMHRALMRAWIRLGRRDDALQQFERCRDALHAAHGARPHPETLALRASLQVAPTVAEDRSEALSIAVLPLATLARDAEVLQGLADSLVDDFSAALARRPALAVVAAPMARAAALRAPGDLLRLAELLRVRYLVTGGLRSAAEGPARLSLNLVCGDDAVFLWGMQAELGAGEDVEERAAAWAADFELQACVAAARASRGAEGNAWVQVRRALRTMFERGWSEESVQLSLQVYREAIAADPEHALALAQKAILLALATNMGLQVGPNARDEARADAERALALAPRNSEVLGYAGCALADLGEARRAEPYVQRAVMANPGNPQAWAAAGAAQLLLGRTEKGIGALERGLRLSPDDYRRPVWHTLLAGAYHRMGQLQQAAEHAQAACLADARYHPARLALAAILIERGDDAAARAALREALRIRPRMQPAEARGWVRKRLFTRMLALWPASTTQGNAG